MRGQRSTQKRATSGHTYGEQDFAIDGWSLEHVTHVEAVHLVQELVLLELEHGQRDFEQKRGFVALVEEVVEYPQPHLQTHNFLIPRAHDTRHAARGMRRATHTTPPPHK